MLIIASILLNYLCNLICNITYSCFSLELYFKINK